MPMLVSIEMGVSVWLFRVRVGVLSMLSMSSLSLCLSSSLYV